MNATATTGGSLRCQPGEQIRAKLPLPFRAGGRSAATLALGGLALAACALGGCSLVDADDEVSRALMDVEIAAVRHFRESALSQLAEKPDDWPCRDDLTKVVVAADYRLGEMEPFFLGSEAAARRFAQLSSEVEEFWRSADVCNKMEEVEKEVQRRRSQP